MPSEPGWFESSARSARPVFVLGLGDAWTSAPKRRMKFRRSAFQSWTARTQYTVVFRPTRLAAYASAVPHCPAPVSVAMRSYPAFAAYQACARAVLTLWLPVGE
jgi:hypothetical protein